MKNAYIRFNDRKYVKLIEKIIIYIKKVLAIVSIEKISINKFEDTFIILIPKYKNYNSYTKYRIVSKIKDYLSSNKIENIIFDENVKFLSKEFNQNNILTGKYLMKNSILGILEYIFNINKINTELENVHIFVNQYSKNNIKIIENMCKKFKTVNIITENLKYYKRLESKLYNEGILVTVSNNKRKSARCAKYVINVDFEKEIIEQYNVNMNSVIINLTNEKVLFEKFFRGVLVNNFEIVLDSDFVYYIEEVYGKVNKKVFLESLILDMNCVEVENELSKYGGKISGLLGVRGRILDSEFNIY